MEIRLPRRGGIFAPFLQSVSGVVVFITVEYAATRLIEINLSRGRPVTALVYVNWYLDHSELGDPRRMNLVHRLMAGMEVCGQ